MCNYISRIQNQINKLGFGSTSISTFSLYCKKHFTVKYILFWNQLAMAWPSMHGHHKAQRPEQKVTNLGSVILVKEDGHVWLKMLLKRTIPDQFINFENNFLQIQVNISV